MDVFDPRVLPICREILLHKKQSLLNGLFEADDLPPPDQSSDGQQLCFPQFADQEQSLKARIQYLLYEIEHALAKIENGVYGYCEKTGLPIDRFRLLATPWVRYGTKAASTSSTEEVFNLNALEAP
jgi:RNA polymerase-binding transcription factor DksA